MTFVTIVMVFLAILSLASAEVEMYTTKYDNTNIEAIIHSDRLLIGYANCLLNNGKCTPQGAELKKNIPDALENECIKCSKIQKAGIQRVIPYIAKNKPEFWKELQAMYDPDGKYMIKYCKRADENGVDLTKTLCK